MIFKGLIPGQVVCPHWYLSNGDLLMAGRKACLERTKC